MRWCFSFGPIKLSCAFSAFLLPSWLPQLLFQILTVCWSRSPHLVGSYPGAGDVTAPAWGLCARGRCGSPGAAAARALGGRRAEVFSTISSFFGRSEWGELQ